MLAHCGCGPLHKVIYALVFNSRHLTLIAAKGWVCSLMHSIHSSLIPRLPQGLGMRLPIFNPSPKHIPLPTALAPISHAQIQPGLGLSESWYSWIISLSSLGEFTGAITYGVLLRFFLTKHLMLVNLSVAAIGGLFYGIGKFGWMLLIGK